MLSVEGTWLLLKLGNSRDRAALPPWGVSHWKFSWPLMRLMNIWTTGLSWNEPVPILVTANMSEMFEGDIQDVELGGDVLEGCAVLGKTAELGVTITVTVSVTKVVVVNDNGNSKGDSNVSLRESDNTAPSAEQIRNIVGIMVV